jgi:hypothetical protein
MDARIWRSWNKVSVLAIAGWMASLTMPGFVPSAYGASACAQGYVWREAFAGDYVCVTPAIRAQAARDNAQADARREPGGGAYGPDTCRQGFVWREAGPDDHVCVAPPTRDQAARDNAQAAHRLAANRPQPIAPSSASSGKAGEHLVVSDAVRCKYPKVPPKDAQSKLADKSYYYTREQYTNRVGGDYRDICNVSSPSDCQAFCAADTKCQSWTWVKPGVQKPYPVCWLKASSPRPEWSTCCTSGLKQARAQGGHTYRIDPD